MLRQVTGAVEFSSTDVYSCDVYVVPEERGSGIAQWLFAECFALWRERGYTRMWGYVADGNPVRKLYERFGWDFGTRHFTVTRHRDGSWVRHDTSAGLIWPE